MINISFPVYSYRNIEHPIRGIKCCMAVVQAANIPLELNDWRNINPRDANPRDYVSKAIRRTINEKPEMFLFLNRGFAVICKGVEFQSTKNNPHSQGVVTLRFDDPAHHGLLDGGHTYDQILNAVQERQNGELNGLFVKIEVLTGFGDVSDIRAVSEGRNTSIQVKEEGLLDIQHKFDGIKAALDGQTYANLIAYSEFELDDDGKPKPIPIREILASLMCFNAAEFTEERHPIIYGQRKKVLKHFKIHQGEIELLYPLLPDILKLWDTIYAEMPQIYDRERGVSGFGHLRGVSVEEQPLYYINSKTKYLIADPYLWPIFATFRTLLKKRRGQYNWAQDPIDVFRNVGGKLVHKVIDRAKEYPNLSEFGKDTSVWELLYLTLERVLNR